MLKDSYVRYIRVIIVTPCFHQGPRDDVDPEAGAAPGGVAADAGVPPRLQRLLQARRRQAARAAHLPTQATVRDRTQFS